MRTSRPIYRSPKLRVQFVITSLTVGGAETLLLNLIRRMDKSAFAPEVVCLKEPGALGKSFAQEVPLRSSLISSKWDARVLFRLTKLFREGPTDAVITVGAGDKMFWGRLSAKLAGVPVICSALHSTGWPDGVGRLNRMLTCITDGFIACAKSHAEYLAVKQGFPTKRLFVIPNGVDTDRFRPNHTLRTRLRKELGVPADCPLVGIVAALRPEKNHEQFVEAGRLVLRSHPAVRFLIVGDGPQHAHLQNLISESGLTSHFHLLGNRKDIQHILPGLDVFCLTSRNEANPVSILEALACGVPVVAPDVGSIAETVIHQQTGLLTSPLSSSRTADAIVQLLGDPSSASALGLAGRQRVRSAWSLEAMVNGYEELIAELYNAKAIANNMPCWQRPAHGNPQLTPTSPAMDGRPTTAPTGLVSLVPDMLTQHQLN